QNAAKIVARVLHFDSDLVSRNVELREDEVQICFVHRLLGKQIDRMRQLQSHVHSLCGAKREPGEVRVNHEPCRDLRPGGFVENIVSLLWLNSEAGRRKL